MSFSADVKEELAKRIGSSRHCRLAELAAIINSTGYVELKNDRPIMLYLQPDNEAVIRKFFTLLKKAFNIGTSFLEESPDIKVNGRVYRPVLGEGDILESCLKAIRLIDGQGKFRPLDEGVSPLITKNSCCRRAFLRDSFLCIGSISDPNN